jgi:uncharacterized membrane protein
VFGGTGAAPGHWEGKLELRKRQIVQMYKTQIPSVAAIHGHPIHAALVPFPIVCFTLVLLTDIAYWRTANLMWQDFSSWLLLAGLVVGGLAALAGAIDLLFRSRVRSFGPAWVHGIGNVAVLLLALVNSLIHAGDGWTAVVPWGLVLSAVTVLVLIVTTWLGRSMVYRYGVGVAFDD